jgi:hypothetical protein
MHGQAEEAHGGEMDTSDPGLFEWAFKGLVGIVLTIGGWLWIMLVRAVSKNREDIALYKEALSEHKLHVSEHYAKKIEIRDVFDALDEVRKDIKTLLARHL